MNNDLISREALKEDFKSRLAKCNKWIEKAKDKETKIRASAVKSFICEVIMTIDNAPAVEYLETSFITECRNAALEQNLPLYFVYYEETGILEVYVTKTKELFEQRRCSKHLPYYKFKEAVTKYLDWYSDWEGGAE